MYYQARLGTNIGEVEKKGACCFTGSVPEYNEVFIDEGAKNAFFAPFIYINDHFTKTGSGQT
jgi:hypothetical protein